MRSESFLFLLQNIRCIHRNAYNEAADLISVTTTNIPLTRSCPVEPASIALFRLLKEKYGQASPLRNLQKITNRASHNADKTH